MQAQKVVLYLPAIILHMKVLLITIFCFVVTGSCSLAQGNSWLAGTWYGHKVFTSSRIAVRALVRMEITNVAGDHFAGRLVYMYPSDTAARLVRSIAGDIEANKLNIVYSEETYLLDPRSRSFWSECAACPSASAYSLNNGNLVLTITTLNCGDTCNGITTFTRPMHNYDEATQAAIVKLLHLHPASVTPPQDQPLAIAAAATDTVPAAGAADSLKDFPKLLTEGMGTHFDPAKYVVKPAMLQRDTAAAALPKTAPAAKKEPAKQRVDKPVTAIAAQAAPSAAKPPAAVATGSLSGIDEIKDPAPLQAEKAAPPVAPQPPTDTVPAALTQRITSLINTYQVQTPRILVQLFDDGQIDGDAVSVYYNGQLIINSQTLTHKAVNFTIEASTANRHHEFILISEGVGMIPPNTALLRIMAGQQKFELTVSSDMNRNAKIAIDYTGD